MQTAKITGPQTEDEDSDSVIVAIFALMLERKAKDYPNLRGFLAKIGMSIGTYYNLMKGQANPTFFTVERTAKALGVSPWEMLGGDERLTRSWLAEMGIDLDKVAASVEARRNAKQGFSLKDFSVISRATEDQKESGI